MENKELIKYESSLIKRVGNAISVTKKLLELSTINEAQTYLESGINNSNSTKYIEAIEDYTKAISINSKFAKAYCNRGFAKHKLKKFTEAIEDYSKGIELNPGEYVFHFYYLRGVAKKDLHNYSEAIKDFSKSIEINPKYANAYNDRGNSYNSLDNISEAIKDYSKTIELNPKYYNGAAYYNRGNAKQKIGDKSACEDWRKAKDLGTTFAEEKLKKYCS